MKKIKRISDEFGTVEWTPNSRLQTELQNAEPDYENFLNDFLGTMFEGYFIALTQSFGSRDNMEWMSAKTVALVEESISRRNTDKVPSSKLVQ